MIAAKGYPRTEAETTSFMRVRGQYLCYEIMIAWRRYIKEALPFTSMFTTASINTLSNEEFLKGYLTWLRKQSPSDSDIADTYSSIILNLVTCGPIRDKIADYNNRLVATQPRSKSAAMQSLYLGVTLVQYIESPAYIEEYQG